MVDFFNAVNKRQLSSTGGVYYLKGGYQNIFGLKPTDPDPAVQSNFQGDDDHPAYSDAQISEANVARAVNQIARSPYWKNSAIVITWDDSEGYYDHVRPPVRDALPGVSYVSEGPRVPLILISPFAKTGVVQHDLGDQVSVVKMIDKVFGLQALASLPNERQARNAGFKEYGQFDMGPLDGDTNNISSLLSAFDPARLAGTKAPLSPAYAIVPDRDVATLPATNGLSCKAIGVVPTDIQLGIQDAPPSDFNPRPGTDPPQNARRVKASTDRIDD